MTGSQWSELMRCTDAEPVASFLDARGNDALVDRVLDESGVEPVADVPAGVEVVRRRGGDRSWLS